MSLLTLGIWIASVLGLLSAGIALLPDGSAHPLPQGVIDATQTLYVWLYSFNNIFPVDVLIQVVGYAVLIEIFTRIVYPLIFWLLKVITGAGE